MKRTFNTSSTVTHSDLERLRNIGIIAHIDAGKTTVSERILFFTGRIHRTGEVHDGNAALDFMPEEQKRGITIGAAATSCEWRDHRFNLIDTPGHIDFTVEVQRSLRVLDGGVVVFDAVAGVEPQTETVWRQADEFGVPRIGFVNKLDRAGANFERTIAMLRTRLGANAVAIQLPIGVEHDFRGVIDLIHNRAIFYAEHPPGQPVTGEIPPELAESAANMRQHLLETLAETDDALLTLLLDDQAVPAETVKAVLRRAVLARQIVPVLGGAALKNKGIHALLDAIVDYLPSPLDRGNVTALELGTDEGVECPPDADAPLAVLVFKLANDRQRGRLVFGRVYSGTLRAGSYVLNSSRNRSEHVARLVRLHADQQETVSAASAGDIVGIIGLKGTYTGDTLCAAEAPRVLEQIRFPEPVLSIALEAKNNPERLKLGRALQLLAEEDPTFRVQTDSASGQVVVWGMGELHLDVLVERIRREHEVEVRTGRPRVSYRATLRRSCQATGKYILQNGGNGQHGHVEFALEPLVRGSGFEFVNRTVGGLIPAQFLSSIEKGARESLANGAGLTPPMPVVDVRVTLVGGSYHEKDSSGEAFQIAASLAVKEGVATAGVVVLEPVMRVTVTTPTEFRRGVTGDLASRRARIVANEPGTGDAVQIVADVPFAEMFGYVTALRSLSNGRAVYVMEFNRYEPVPAQIQAAIQANGKAD
jgi:elongation factor G